ncbi:hypothetical protein QZM56_35140, partial [Burkholderia contaminans]
KGRDFKAAALIDLSTVADIEISNPPWVKFQSAGWVNFPSAPTGNLIDSRPGPSLKPNSQQLLRHRKFSIIPDAARYATIALRAGVPTP